MKKIKLHLLQHSLKRCSLRGCEARAIAITGNTYLCERHIKLIAIGKITAETEQERRANPSFNIEDVESDENLERLEKGLPLLPEPELERNE